MSSSKSLRLIFPEWQGGYDLCFLKSVPELTEADRAEAMRGYFLGSKILSIIAPQNPNQKTVEVPVSNVDSELETKNGIYAYDACLKNLKSALKILEDEKPEKVLTIGGECSVSVPAFTYLSKKYNDEIGIVWIDAHPDINMPGDKYLGYNAMALTLCMGMGDKNFTDALPSKVPTEKCCLVGLRSMESEAKERKEKIGLKSIGVEEYRKNKNSVVEWAKAKGIKKVLVHLDLDVLDPKDVFVAVGYEPNGLFIKEVVEIINELEKSIGVYGLTLAERMPIEDLRLKLMMKKMPLFK